MLRSADAEKIGKRVLELARGNGLNPMAVAVLSASGQLLFFRMEDGNPLLREAIARGKAVGALGLGMDSANVAKMYAERPGFVNSAIALTGGSLIPAAGGVVVRDPKTNAVLGAVGVSGDLSDKDEACAIEAIRAAGFTCAAIKENRPQTLIKASL